MVHTIFGSNDLSRDSNPQPPSRGSLIVVHQKSALDIRLEAYLAVVNLNRWGGHQGGLSMRVMAFVFTTMMVVGLANSASAARYSTDPSRDHQFVNGCGGGSCYR